jgi:hypothetical protein
MGVSNRPRPGDTASDRLARAERDREIIRLKRRGVTYTGISELMHVSADTAIKVVTTAAREAADAMFTESSLYVAEKLDQLGLLLNAVWDKAMAGDIKAIAEARHILADMSDYTGARAPIQYRLGETDVDRAIRELEDNLNARARQAEEQAADPAEIAD